MGESPQLEGRQLGIAATDTRHVRRRLRWFHGIGFAVFEAQWRLVTEGFLGLDSIELQQI